MATVGAFLGPKGVLAAAILTALVGGIYSVGLLVKSRRVGTNEKSPKLCYGVAIALGTIVSIFLKGHVW
jgi:prepilin signal peptidase PulO-like enzyme (type II secretory pathway)